MSKYVTNRLGKLVDKAGRVVTGGPATKEMLKEGPRIESGMPMGPGGIGKMVGNLSRTRAMAANRINPNSVVPKRLIQRARQSQGGSMPPKQMTGARLEEKMARETGAKRVNMEGVAETAKKRGRFVSREKVGEARKPESGFTPNRQRGLAEDQQQTYRMTRSGRKPNFGARRRG